MSETQVTPHGARKPSVRRRWIALVVAALLVAIIWAAGGFRPGGDLRHFAVGENIDLGPMNVTVIEAKARKDYKGLWEVGVLGECQVTTPEGLELSSRSTWLFATASDTPRPRLIGEPSRVQIGGSTRANLFRNEIPGGLPPMPCLFVSQMPDGFDPSTGILFALQTMEWRDPSILQNQTEDWRSGRLAYRTSMPVQVVQSSFY